MLATTIVTFGKQILVLVCNISHEVQWRMAVKWNGGHGPTE